MENIELQPISKKPCGIINIPGSKSIANRVLPLASLANGTSILHNIPSDAEDVSLMLQALEKLGIEITKITEQTSSNESAQKGSDELDDSTPTCNAIAAKNIASYRIRGCGGKFPIKQANLFCGNSGTTIRFLTAILAVMDGSYNLTGIQRMCERPIKDLVDALKPLGAHIDYEVESGFPPLQIYPFKDSMLDVVKVSGRVSSQYLTGMLMALPFVGRDVEVEIYDELISKPYVTITLELLKKFGCLISTTNKNYHINKGNTLNGIEYTVEPDASSASYFLAMGALAGDITVNHLSDDSLQGDKNFAKVLQQMGAKVTYLPNKIRVAKGELRAIDINMEDMPDVAMTIAVVALFAKGTTKISGIHSWKVKETDRLVAMRNELVKLGAKVIITDNSIIITPPDKVKPGVTIDTYNDHRMAMCFSLIAICGVSVTINDYKCVNKTFPSYFSVLKELCY